MGVIIEGGYKTNGILINSYSLMKKNFNYDEIREILVGSKAWQVTIIIKEDPYPKTCCSRNRECLLGILERKNLPELAIYEDSVTEETEAVRIDAKKLTNFLGQFGEGAEDECAEQIVEQLKDILDMPLNWDQVWELLVFCGLFVYVQRSADEDSIASVRKNIERKQKITEIVKEFFLQESPTELPCFCEQTGPESLKRNISVLINDTDKPILVKLKDCALRRHVQPHSRLPVLTANGRVVSFFPRLCAVPGHVIYQEECKLISVDLNGTIRDAVSLERVGAAMFASSKECGLMVADENGNLLFAGEKFWGKHPQKSVCWLAGDLEDYGFIAEDGSYLGLSEKPKWENLLFCNLGSGRGVAVNQNRKAINHRGEQIGENVAAVSCCYDRSIILRMDGTVRIFCSKQHRELSELVNQPVHAICADFGGFWIATEETVFRLEGDDLNRLTVTKQTLALDEICRDNSGTTVFALSTDDEITCFRGI